MSLAGALDAKCEQCRDRPPTMRIGPLGEVEHPSRTRCAGSVVLAHWGDQPELVGVLAVPMEAR